jgi:hypothetical protein
MRQVWMLMALLGCTRAELWEDCSGVGVTCASGLTCERYSSLTGEERADCVVGCGSRFCLEDEDTCREGMVSDGPQHCSDTSWPTEPPAAGEPIP